VNYTTDFYFFCGSIVYFCGLTFYFGKVELYKEQTNYKFFKTIRKMKKVLLLSVAVFSFAFFPSCKKAVESVSLNKNSLALEIGQSEVLVATIVPSDAEITTNMNVRKLRKPLLQQPNPVSGVSHFKLWWIEMEFVKQFSKF